MQQRNSLFGQIILYFKFSNLLQELESNEARDSQNQPCIESKLLQDLLHLYSEDYRLKLYVGNAPQSHISEILAFEKHEVMDGFT
jgi:hypothetical protein